jgi:hypothetical protein
MKTEIYLLVDCDGEVVCAFSDKEKAIKESKECGVDVETTILYNDETP